MVIMTIYLLFRWSHGSPVHRYGLYALQWIVEVNGKPTPDLDAFVDVTKVLMTILPLHSKEKKNIFITLNVRGVGFFGLTH